jgi:hypothetical protein
MSDAAADWPVLSIHGALFNFNFKNHTSHFFKQKVNGWYTQDPTVPARKNIASPELVREVLRSYEQY